MSDERKKSVKEWPEDERLRERLLKYGVEGLSDAQLLAIIIRNGGDGRSAVDLGIELLEKFGGLDGIAQAGISEFRGKNGIKGIGPAKIAAIKASIELGRRHQKPSLASATFCSSGDVVSYYQPRTKDLKKEMFRCALLDTKNKIIQDEVVSVGTLTASLVHPRETFRAAIRESAAAVIFIHNHPSGDAKPSSGGHPPDPPNCPGRRGARHPGLGPHHRRRKPLQLPGQRADTAAVIGNNAKSRQ